MDLFSYRDKESVYGLGKGKLLPLWHLKPAREAINRAPINKDDIDHVIVATITPDYRDFPATANLVQHSLGLGNVGSFDIKAACTGFVYGLSVGRGLLESGVAKKYTSNRGGKAFEYYKLERPFNGCTVW